MWSNFIAHGLSKAGGEERRREREEGSASPDAERRVLVGNTRITCSTLPCSLPVRQGQDRPPDVRKLEVERTIPRSLAPANAKNIRVTWAQCRRRQ